MPYQIFNTQQIQDRINRGMPEWDFACNSQIQADHWLRDNAHRRHPTERASTRYGLVWHYYAAWMDPEPMQPGEQLNLPVISLADSHKETNMLTCTISRKKDTYTYIYVKSPQLASLIDGMRTRRTGSLSDQTYNWELDGWEYRKESDPTFRPTLRVWRTNEEGLASVGFQRVSRPFHFNGRRIEQMGAMLLTSPDLTEGFYFRTSTPQGVDALRAFAASFRKGVEDLINLSKEISITLNLTSKPVAAAEVSK